MEQNPNIVCTESLSIGETLTIENISKTATTYRAEFVGAGVVTFQVLPGGEFSVESSGAPVRIYIDSSAPSGITPVSD